MFKALRRHIKKLFKKPKVESRVLLMSIRYMQNTDKKYPYGVIFHTCNFIQNTAHHNALINRN